MASQAVSALPEAAVSDDDVLYIIDKAAPAGLRSRQISVFGLSAHMGVAGAIATANDALATATAAQSAADAAQSAADAAQTTAADALLAANSANTTAGNALTAANSAQTTAADALATANAASATAADALTAANAAQSSAITAQGTANTALTKANDAQATAAAANATANTAKSAADAATAAVSGLQDLAYLDTVGAAQINAGAISNSHVAAAAAIDSSKLSYLQAGAGATARSIQDRLRSIVWSTDFSNDAAGISAAQTVFPHVHVPFGTFTTTTARTIDDGRIVEFGRGTVLNASGGGSWSLGSGGSVISKTDGVGFNVWLWRRRLDGAVNAGSGAFGGYSPSAFHFDITDAQTLTDVATDPFGRGMLINVVTSAGITGGRNGLQTTLRLSGTPAAEGANQRYYTSFQSTTHADVNLTGTDTGTGSRGSVYGGGAAAYALAAATNLHDFVGFEVNTFAKAGATKQYHSTFSVVGFNAQQAATIDAGIRIAGGADGYATHAGWKTAILFTDANGASPTAATSKLMDTYWTGGGTKTIDRAFDLAGYACSNEILRTQNFRMAANLISFTGAAAFALIDCSADATTNCALHLRSKGTSSIFLGRSDGSTIAEFTNIPNMIMSSATSFGPQIQLTNTTNDNGSALMLVSKRRGSAIVQNADWIGYFQFLGWDGAANREAGYIQCVVDGVPGSSDMPGCIRIGATSDGSSSALPVAEFHGQAFGGSNPVWLYFGAALRNLNVGATNSGGAGFRQVIVAN